MSASGSTRAILAALTANAGIAVAKFVGFLITGSSSMLAESVHSVADTSNQALLLLGQRRARREATSLHPFGYGRSRYFYSFVVALVLFTLGAVFALYEGYHKISHPEPLTSPLVAVVILVVAIGLESYSFRTAMVAVHPAVAQPGTSGGPARGHRRASRAALRPDGRRTERPDR
jgi:cation diffusion facilitator family transporter